MDDADLTIPEIGPRASLDLALVSAAGARHGFGPVLEARDLGGTYNLNARLWTATGAYVLRVYRPWLTRERLAMLHELRRTLAAAGFPVAEPLTLRGGGTVGSYGDRLLEAERFVAGDGGADTWEQYEAAFEWLGRLHDFLAGWAVGRTFVPPRVSNYATPDALAGWVGRTAGWIKTARTETPQHREEFDRAESICGSTLEMLGLLGPWWRSESTRLPVQPIHGDYGGDNLIFEDDSVKLILDFDFLSLRERVFDLAYSLFWMLWRLEGERPPASSSWDRVSGMLARYNAATSRPLTNAELTALPIEMARAPLYWVGEAGLTPDPLASVLGQEARVEMARRLLERRRELADLFRRSV